MCGIFRLYLELFVSFEIIMTTSIRTGMLRVLVFSALFLLGMTSRSLAQFETATVLGTVFDSQKAVVQQTHITLLNLDTGTSQEAVSSSDGSYQFLEVRVGRYRVTAEATGFKKSQRRCRRPPARRCATSDGQYRTERYGHSGSFDVGVGVQLQGPTN
jgi:hypothetical protein